MAGESALMLPVQALTQKAGTWREAWNWCKRSAEKYRHVPDSSRGAKKREEPRSNKRVDRPGQSTKQKLGTLP